jgi:quercetin dioxygenase-like cupin family protein
MIHTQPIRSERLIHVSPETLVELIKGISVCPFASGSSGAIGFSTGFAILSPGARLPYHTHPCSESITTIKGKLQVAVEGRTYHLSAFDSIHVPADTAHTVASLGNDAPTVVLTAFASEVISRTVVSEEFAFVDRKNLLPGSDDPESLMRFKDAAEHEPFPKTVFKDLFASRPGSAGICGGYARLAPGSSLPCHTVSYDETSTIVKGLASYIVAGRKYSLSDKATLFVPEGVPRQLVNEGSEMVELIWVYAGEKPERTVIDSRLCDGS